MSTLEERIGKMLWATQIEICRQKQQWISETLKELGNAQAEGRGDDFRLQGITRERLDEAYDEAEERITVLHKLLSSWQRRVLGEQREKKLLEEVNK